MVGCVLGCPRKHSTIDFLRLPDVGSWWHTHSTTAFMSAAAAAPANSGKLRTRSSGTATLLELVTTTDACRYSSFDLSSSAATASPLYILTAGDDRVPQHRANVTFGSDDSRPYSFRTTASLLSS